MYRFMLALLLAATAAPLAAFFAAPNGYSLDEYSQTSGVGSVAWDLAPGGTDFYASHNGGVRRFDTATNSFASTAMFPIPSGLYFDAMAIDPAAPDDFYVSASDINNSTLHRVTRTGPDTSTIANANGLNNPGYFVYRMVFVPDVATVPAALRGQLIAACVDTATFSAGIFLVDRATLTLTQLIDVGTSNGSGPLTADNQGNVYTVIPPTFGSFFPCVLKRYAAVDVAAAIGGSVVTTGADVIPASANEWNIPALAAREEGGGTFIYYSTNEHASIFRHCIQTGESREFIHGFGGISDGYLHFAQGGTFAFSSDVDDFHPAGGGSVRLAVPFSVYTPAGGFSSVYNSVFIFEPEPVNIAVASLTLVQAPSAINHGVPFSLSVTAHNSGGGTITSRVAVLVTATGAGELHGFTFVSLPGGSIIVAGLVYTTGTVPGSVTLTISVSGAPGVAVTTAAIPVVAPAAEIAVSAQPTSVEDSEFFAVTLEVRAAGGALVQSGPDAVREVSVALASGPGNIWGDLSETASGGIVQFDTLVFDAPGSYVLEFTSPGLPAETANFTVTAASNGGGGGGSGSDDSGGDNSGSCSAGSGSALSLAGLLGLMLVACKLRRRRSA